jgi:CRP/FNR family cyclic AMP-dependent transcriptional regulator
MIDRFQGANSPNLVAAVLRVALVQNKSEIAEDLIASGTLVEYNPGDTLIVQNDGTNDVFLLAAGTVQVTAHGVETRTLGAHAHVGEMSAIHAANPRSATVTATTVVVALKVPGRKFVEICDKYEGTWKFIAQELSNRLFDRNRLIRPPNDKPKAFIMSSIEGLDVAKEIQSGVQRDALPTVWTNGVFWASSYPLEVLEAAVEDSDFGIAVAKFEDVIHTRGTAHVAMRDNVVFELGMFIGRLGRHRTFLVHPAIKDLVLPSDLKGITTLSYIVPAKPDEITPRIAPVCTEIVKIIRQRGVRKHVGV